MGRLFLNRFYTLDACGTFSGNKAANIKYKSVFAQLGATFKNSKGQQLLYVGACAQESGAVLEGLPIFFSKQGATQKPFTPIIR